MGFALRGPILWASRKPFIKRALTALPLIRAVVGRFVAGEHLSDAVRVACELRREGLLVSIDHLGEDVSNAQQVAANVREAEELVRALQDAGLAEGCEISIKLSALGQSFDGELAVASALRVARSAQAAGMLLTLDMEDHTTTNRTLFALRRVREHVPTVGVAIQAMLRRTPVDLAQLIETGSRVRLVKGAYDEPENVAARSAGEIEAAYAAALQQLFAGDGYPMVATHSPALIARAVALAERHGMDRNSFEVQMLYGIRAAEQRRLAAAGYRVRIYVPYGTDWYGYLTRRLAEKPANLLLFLRSLRPERVKRPARTSTPTPDPSPAPGRAGGAHERTGHGRDHISPGTQQ